MRKSSSFLLVAISLAVFELYCAESRNTMVFPCGSIYNSDPELLRMYANVRSVDVDPCDSYPCSFVGHNQYTVTITVHFDTPIEPGNDDVKLTAVLGPVHLPFPGFEQTHLCEQLVNATCPLAANQAVVYRSNLSIPKDIPLEYLPSRIPIWWQVAKRRKGWLRDLMVMCFRTEIRIVSHDPA